MKYNLKNEFNAHGLKFKKLGPNAAGKKYEVLEDCSIQTNLRPTHSIGVEFVSLSSHGLLTLHKGFKFDGASGPTYDDFRNLLPSAFHDGGYAMLRAEALGVYVPATMHDKTLRNFKACRKWFDVLYADLLSESWPMHEPMGPGFFMRRWMGVKRGLRYIRKKANYAGVHYFGASSARP